VARAALWHRASPALCGKMAFRINSCKELREKMEADPAVGARRAGTER
jgi:hypothetical protein